MVSQERISLIKTQLFDKPTKLTRLDNSKHEGKASNLLEKQKTQLKLLEGMEVGWRVKDLLLFFTVITCTQHQLSPSKGSFLLIPYLFADKKIPPLISVNDNLRMLQKIQITDQHSGERLVYCQNNWPAK